MLYCDPVDRCQEQKRPNISDISSFWNGGCYYLWASLDKQSPLRPFSTLPAGPLRWTGVVAMNSRHPLYMRFLSYTSLSVMPVEVHSQAYNRSARNAVWVQRRISDRHVCGRQSCYLDPVVWVHDLHGGPDSEERDYLEQ
jgi:hypothetical protein